ncbi:MAG: NAD(P)-dependent glycerol-1-phosphate dehydrogenase [Candidatus Altiarchaeales archaeon]|nr:MAG: NAD(P)-dependent glycerol-1-phosphate dehydrogenase [Candidatus Altiarchaeales archaeon]
MKDIELPRKVIVGEGAIEKIGDLVRELALVGNSLVIADANTAKIAGDRVKSDLGSEIYILRRSIDRDIQFAIDLIKEKNIGYLVGVGGGTVIDITKVCAYKTEIPFLSVPTAASHDGITSPQASLKGRKPVSIRVHSALGILADTEIIRKAPPRLTAAGCADAISNYTAVLDWKIAHEEKGEYYGDYAASLSMMSAQIVMHNAEKIKDHIDILVEALISSGVAMGIAGSSRPCSGSEHQFSHALDLICPKPALHGEQCGVGAIMMAYLHGTDWEKVKNALKTVGAPINSRELNIDDKYIIRALMMANKIRDRYTILGDGLSREDAVDLARVTGVIK